MIPIETGNQSIENLILHLTQSFRNATHTAERIRIRFKDQKPGVLDQKPIFFARRLLVNMAPFDRELNSTTNSSNQRPNTSRRTNPDRKDYIERGSKTQYFRRQPYFCSTTPIESGTIR
jgi:hypothetical protein